MTDPDTPTSQPEAPGAPKPASGQNPAGTRELILDVAEGLFAENGVAATSIRDITGEAGVNLGAINYHFGTKQDLVAAVFTRRLEPVSNRQWALLDEVEKEAGEGPPRLEALIEAMIRPPVERSFEAGKKDTAFMRLVGRCYGEPNPEVERRIRSHLEKVWTRFAVLLSRALPGLTPEEMYWRVRFTVGAFHHTLLTTGREANVPPEMQEGLNAETMICRLVAFAAAGMRAGL
ncbi:MAG TPA: TetR/AcrR family transcriptional regulator [Terriglobia bacterium]|nr:TetR/AcrR family transcriptional regulator [Terriglobia bacterium]